MNVIICPRCLEDTIKDLLAERDELRERLEAAVAAREFHEAANRLAVKEAEHAGVELERIKTELDDAMHFTAHPGGRMRSSSISTDTIRRILAGGEK